MKEITASVTGQNLVLDQTVLNVAGTVNLYNLKITFDEDWENADTKIVSFSNGCGKAIAVEYDETNGVTIPWEVLQAPEIQILVGLRDGEAQAVAWGCDLTYEYVRINGDYRT